MTKAKEKITISRKLSAEGEAMNMAFKKATKRATSEAFTVRKTILVERGGWLVRVRQDGRVWSQGEEVATRRDPEGSGVNGSPTATSRLPVTFRPMWMWPRSSWNSENGHWGSSICIDRIVTDGVPDTDGMR
jgi:hypothetical protein